MTVEYLTQKQSRTIQQSLSPDKMPIAFLLGAGCPLSVRVPPGNTPLIPDVAGLTQAISNALSTDSSLKDDHALIQSHLLADGHANATVEDMLTHIRTLLQAAGKDEARGLSCTALCDLDAKICELIDDAVRQKLPCNTTSYHQLARWVNTIPRKYPVEVFTTNYDLLMEQAFEEMGIPYFDGFVGSNRTFFDPPSMELDDLPPRWSRLWKLHGSINWRQDETSRIVSRGEVVAASERRLIHPSHLKYDESRRMPYLAMMDRLRSFLRKSPAVIVCCGYSFSDQHINEILVQGLQGNASSVCFALMYSDLSSYSNAIACAERRPNLCLLAKDQALIGCQQGKWSGKDEFLLGDFAKFTTFLSENLDGDSMHAGGTNGS